MRERKFPVVYRFREKYGDDFYLINDQAQLQKLWLTILEERFNEGWYSWMEDYTPHGFKKLEYTKDDLDALPKSMKEEKEKMSMALLKEERGLLEQANARTDYNNIQKAIETKDSLLAHRLLSEFANGEYEGFEEVDLITLN